MHGGIIITNEKVKPNNVNNDLVNEKIRFKEVLVIADDGEQLGTMTRNEALNTAYDRGLDLLCVAPNATPPVCRILDYGKYHYAQQKKAKEAKKKQQVVETKTLRLTPVIDRHDFETKQSQVAKWAKDGMRTRVEMKLKGRLITKADYGKTVMEQFAEGLCDLVNMEKEPKLEGNTLSCLLTPKRK